MDLEGVEVAADALSAFDVDEIEPEAPLFQTGYLTIAGWEGGGTRARYRLGYPNREVRESPNRWLLRGLAPTSAAEEEKRGNRLVALLRAADFAGLETLFRSVFASVPHHGHDGADVARHEAWFASVFYSYFPGSGLDARVEDATNRGRVDMAVLTDERVCPFEFKVRGSSATGAAMRQPRERGYAEKYRDRGLPIHLVGVEFDAEKRNGAAFEIGRA